MRERVSASVVFITGAARFSNAVYLIARDAGLEEEDVPHTRFIGFYKGELGHMGDRPWKAVAVCIPKKPAEKMVSVGEDGQVFTYVGGKSIDESIKPKPSVLRGAGVVDGFAYACGMNRQVFLRSGESTWRAMHAPTPSKGVTAGFEDIAGYNKDEIYAVGWEGEIWEWNGRTWTEHPSPTNLILTGVCCGADGQVYTCGQNGTLIRGRHDTWLAMDIGNMNDDLWDVCWFKDRLYLSSMTMLYTYSDGECLPVEFGTDDAPGTFGRLTDAEGVLWSIGSSDVFMFDGDSWARID